MSTEGGTEADDDDGATEGGEAESGTSGSTDSGAEASTGDSSGGESGGSDTTGEPPIEPGTHFEEAAIEWTVPRTHDGHAPSQLATTFTAVTDLDGDGSLELVSTGQCLETAGGSCNYTAWGDENDNAHWRVYGRSGDGFGDDPEAWSVPRTNDTSAPPQLWTTFTAVVDLDGDAMPELVSSGRCLETAGGSCTYTAWGDENDNAHWRIYANTGIGFADGYDAWAVPRTHDTYAPSQLGGTFTAVVDLDGDDRPELVSTGHCRETGGGSCTYTAWGDENDDAHWRIYANTGDGFADSHDAWAVPRTHDTYAPSQLAGTFTAVIDLDGDDRPELVSAGQCLETGGGSCTYTAWDDENDDPHWRVYANTGDGFADSHTAWPIPRTHDGRAPAQLGSTFTGLVDMNSDGMPDLVSSGRCLETGGGSCNYVAWGDERGSAHWRVYANTGDGFAAQPDEWSVPDTHDDAAPPVLYGTFTGVLDLDDDGRVDLLSTGQCLESAGGSCTYTAWDDETGTPHWRLYRGVP